MKIARSAVAGVLAWCACAAGAADRDGLTFALDTGVAAQGSYSVSVGLGWPWSWERNAAGAQWTATTELFVSHWSSNVHGERESRTLVGALPVFRLRFADGRSNWFGEGGVGVTYMDALYRTDEHQFSTQFNFISALGVGRSFGTRREQDLSLRVAHVSNAGIKNPNPGETFLQLRYSRAF
jgi:lipid A 3-O-deacylase